MSRLFSREEVVQIVADVIDNDYPERSWQRVLAEARRIIAALEDEGVFAEGAGYVS